MPDPQMVSNELAIIFGIITTMITVASAVVAIFQCRRHRRPVAKDIEMQSSSTRSDGRRQNGIGQDPDQKTRFELVFPVEIKTVFMASILYSSNTSSGLPRPNDIVPRHGTSALVQHHRFPTATSRFHSISITAVSLPWHALPTSDRILNARNNHAASIDQVIQVAAQCGVRPRIAVVRGSACTVRPAIRSRVAWRRDGKASAVVKHVACVSKEADGGVSAGANSAVLGSQILGHHLSRVRKSGKARKNERDGCVGDVVMRAVG